MNTTRVALLASRGTLDGAYPPFVLATTSAALGFETKMFFTFYGLVLLKHKLDLQMSSLGNPAMPMPLPIPVALQALPGMQWLMTTMMKKKISSKNIASVETLRTTAVDAGVELIACQMSMDLFGLTRADLIDGVEVGGAATFLEFAASAKITLFT